MSCLLLLVTSMTAEPARGSELAELVSNHVLCNVNRNKLVTVMHSYGMTHEIGADHRCAGPCLDNSLLTTLIHGKNLLLEANLNVWTFLK